MIHRLLDHNMHSLRFSEWREDAVAHKALKRASEMRAPVSIGDKSWIGAKVIVLNGVQIGEGAIVGAGSVVARDVPPWTIAAGNPARVLRDLRDDERE